ncbi:hypothetical protein [Saccharopolyspora hattusasensis]|uniref:hypothetical protein n=1 Tax=Saccharopolyspora hattusasensis TaxID=1128679 RepID=UPI003D99C98E
MPEPGADLLSAPGLSSPLVIGTVNGAVTGTQLGNEQFMMWTTGGLTAWLGWAVPLTLAQLWLDRRPKHARAR